MTTRDKFMAMRDLAYEIDNDMGHQDKLDFHDTLDLRHAIRVLQTLDKRHGSKLVALEAAE